MERTRLYQSGAEGCRGGNLPASSDERSESRVTSPGVTGPQGPPRGGSAPYGKRSDAPDSKGDYFRVFKTVEE
jgi:hypothetical protein